MGIYTFTFSPTGGTEKVMNILCREFGEAQAIDLMAPVEAIKLEPSDVALIGVPSFGGRIPGIAGQRLGQVQGNGAKAILVVVYGNRAIDDTLIELKDVAEGCGFRVVGAISAVAEHSIMRHVAAGRPDAEDEAQLREFAKAIRSRMDSADDVQVPGKRPYKNFGGAGMFPETTDRCTGCGLCAEKCPVGAIPVDDPSSTDRSKCICCMGCIAVCPSQARKKNDDALAATIERLKNAVSGRKPNALFL